MVLTMGSIWATSLSYGFYFTNTR